MATSYVVKGKSMLNIDVQKVAAEGITPGSLIELNSDDKFQNHATAGGTVFPCFALVDVWQGNKYDDDYSTGDECFGWYPTPGDIVENAILNGNSTNIAIGDPLESVGNGRLRKSEESSEGTSSYSQNIVGFALEAVTTDGERAAIQVA